jgi:ABC-type multidrug transport system ATPase subunit
VASVALRMEAVTSAYRGGPPVLRGVDIGLRAGELATVRGPNGSGKTTLLKVAAGLLRPLSGRLQQDGDVGYVPQTGADPPPRLSASRWFEFACPPGCAPDAVRILDELEGPPAFSPLLHPSGGSLAKVLLAAALAGPGRLLVLDEPFASLDAASRTTAAALIHRAAAEGCAVLLSDHTDTAVAGPTLRMHEGLLVADGNEPPDHWRVTVRDSAGALSVAVVTSDERDRLLLDVLTAGGHVLGVQEVR